MKPSVRYFIVLLSAVFFLTACANSYPDPGTQYGFLSGLLHGFILPFSFIISIFDSDVAIYGLPNTGVWYDLGFVLGAGAILGGGGRSSK